MKNSVISEIPGDEYIVIKRSYFQICHANSYKTSQKTKLCAAALLSFYEHKHNSTLTSNGEFNDGSEIKIMAGNKHLVNGLLSAFSPNLIRLSNRLLAELQYIKIDSTVINNNENLPNEVFLNVENINNALKSYYVELPVSSPSKKGKSDSLYLIQDEILFTLKIGRSKDVSSRMKNLQKSTSNRLRLLFEIPNLGSKEKQIHKMFEHYSLSNEWFQYSSEIINYFKTINQ
jgi:hypothetical protein